ncbi:vWA domain-containing protein [Adlercreutzia caecimuris]|uniref:VWA domain-containing protein n=1 Tax=Adlercreutzia caecimuris TaxID=671266 RepID=A0A4S4FZ79_9ACTN|nr:VWA domain-containing protein [Adlercreutzia caecimuris]THG35954.1 VWA domain-containing protein [Adlercreutzia caecimuris]
MVNPLIDTRDMIQPENHSTRIPVVLCLDTSQSMTTNGGFEALNEGVQAFFETCKNDPVNRLGFDVAIVTFGAQGVSKVQDFRPIWNQEEVPSFEFVSEHWIDGTPMGKGIDLAMKGLERRKGEYKEEHVSYYQPFLVIITDGQSTEIVRQAFDSEEEFEESRKRFDAVKRALVDLQRNRKLKVIALGVGNEDYSELADFVVDKKVLLAKDFSAFDLLFEFMSKSMSNSSGIAGNGTIIEESPLAQIVEDLEDEGVVSICIEDFGRDED